MLRIRPFHALRPAGNRAALVSCPPAAIACGCCVDPSDESFRAVVGGPDERAARSALERLVGCGALAADPEPRLFVYRISRQGRRQVGVVAHVDRRDLVRLEQDAPPWAEPSPALFADSRGEIADLTICDMNERPLFHFNADDGTTHTGWLARDPQRYRAAFERIEGCGELLGPAARAVEGFVLAALFDRAGALDPAPPLRCGLFVQRTILAT